MGIRRRKQVYEAYGFHQALAIHVWIIGAVEQTHDLRNAGATFVFVFGAGYGYNYCPQRPPLGQRPSAAYSYRALYPRPSTQATIAR
jgi:hypothetical protein